MAGVDQVGPEDVSSFTIKGNGAFDSPWHVVKGSPASITRQLVDAYALTPEEIEGKAPFQIWNLAANKASLDWAGCTVSKAGGTQEKPRGGVNRGSRPNGPAASGGGTAAKAEEENPNAGILASLEAADSIDALKLVYGKNVAAFEHEQKEGKSELLDALTARKLALKASA